MSAATSGSGEKTARTGISCSICPHIKGPFLSAEQYEAHKKTKKHIKNEAKDLRLRSAKINIYRYNPQVAINKITGYFLRQGYGSLNDVKTKSYQDGAGYLLVVFESTDSLTRAAAANPHHAAGIRFAVKPNQLAAPTEMESEGDKMDEVISGLFTSPNLDHQMTRLYGWLALERQDHMARRDFLQNIQQLCRRNIRVLQSCYVYAFGSSVNGLGMKKCDLDMVILTNGPVTQKWNGPLPDSDRLLKALRSLLMQHQNSLQLCNIVPIPAARIPIIKFTHLPTLLSGDISLNRRAGILNSQLIGALMEFSLTAKLLSFVIRLWGKKKEFVGGGGLKINSYTMTLMCIFYLQQVNMLPPLRLLKHADNTILDDGVECFYLHEHHFTPFRGKMATVPTDELLKGFCEFYIRYDFSESIISILEGRSLCCSENSDTFNVMQLNVQDPFDLSYNTAKSVQTKTIILLRQSLLTAFLHPNLTTPIQPAPNPTNPQISSASNPQPAATDWGIQLLLTPPPEEDKSKFFLLDVPYRDRLTPGAAYIQLCVFVVNKLRGLYRMEFFETDPEHVISETLSTRKRLSLCSEEDTNKRKRLSSEGGSSTEVLIDPVNVSNQVPDATDTSDKADISDKAATSDKADTSDKAETQALTGTEPANKLGDREQTTPTICTSPVPMSYFIPYHIQVKSKYLIFGHHQELEKLDYEKYCAGIGERLAKIQDPSEYKLDFKLNFAPTDSQFKQLKIGFTACLTHKVDSVIVHLTKVLPEAIKLEMVV